MRAIFETLAVVKIETAQTRSACVGGTFASVTRRKTRVTLTNRFSGKVY